MIGGCIANGMGDGTLREDELSGFIDEPDICSSSFVIAFEGESPLVLAGDEGSTLPRFVAVTTFGGLAELKYRPPPGLEKNEYALRVAGKGRKS